jgi:hypothetical protein
METFFYIGVVKRPYSQKNAMLFRLSDHISRKVYINESLGAYTIKDIQ